MMPGRGLGVKRNGDAYSLATQASAVRSALQLKISLQGIEPLIWRRVRVPGRWPDPEEFDADHVRTVFEMGWPRLLR